MSKIAVIVTDYFEDIEFTSPVEALKKEGHEIVVIENEKNKEIKGKKGLVIKSDIGISEIKYNDYDAILIPGGFSPDILRSDERYVEFVKKFLLTNKPIFAICHGPQLFIQTGLAKGRILTSYKTVQQDLYYAGAIVKDESVVVDNNLVTSRTPADLDDFNREIVNILK